MEEPSQDKLKRLWESGASIRAIAEELNIGADTVGFLRRKMGLKPRTAKTRARKRSQKDPSQEEIAERAAQVRAGWDDETFRRRAGVVERPFEFPTVNLDDIDMGAY